MITYFKTENHKSKKPTGNRNCYLVHKIPDIFVNFATTSTPLSKSVSEIALTVISMSIGGMSAFSHKVIHEILGRKNIKFKYY